MIDLPKYDSYKDSGFEWLGEIPEHWEALRAKHVFRNVSEKGFPNEPLLSATQDKGVIPRDQLEQRVVMPIGQLETFKRVCENDFVISLRSFQGGIEHCAYRGLVSPAYTVLRLHRDVKPGYLRHLLKASNFISEINISVTGIRQGKNIDYQDFAESFLPIPPKPEQDRIVAFLDKKTAEIDTLIVKKQRQIELLDEQKAILINRAVTRGLNPNAKLKPSGIEWIGDIPEHWEATQLRRIIDGIEQGVSPATVEGEVTKNDWGVLKSGCCNGGVFRETEHKRLPTNFKFDSNIAVKPGDLLVSRACGSRDLVGSTALVETVSFNLILSDKNFRIRSRPLVDRRFLNQSMNSFHYRRQLDPRISGADGLPNNIPGARLKEIVIPLPPPEEQEVIIHHLSNVIKSTAKSVASAESQIQSLKTLRSILIAHAVTGRIKV